VDVGTGYYVEKSVADAVKFYNTKVDVLGKNLADLEKIVGQKSQNVRMVEEVLRVKVMAQQGQQQQQG
jgi:prefoldin alpha subunit